MRSGRYAKLCDNTFANNTIVNNTLVHKISSFRYQSALGALSAILLSVSFCPPDASAETGAVQSGDPNFVSNATLDAQNSDQILFQAPENFSAGRQTVVATHTSGLILEFHKSDTDELGYQVGQQLGPKITWGERQSIVKNRYWPGATLTKEGYVILVYSNTPSDNGSALFYRVGKIDPQGGVNQTIQWLNNGEIFWDYGFHPSVDVNDDGVIVGVHEAAGDSINIHYRIGHLTERDGSFNLIAWDSGNGGVHYDWGINPKISINNKNEVVAVHQVPGEWLLHYRRGTVDGGKIIFGESRRYSDNGAAPRVDLLDNGTVVEVHRANGLAARLGTLSTTDNVGIDWFEAYTVVPDGRVEDPAVAVIAGTHVIATFNLGGDGLYSMFGVI